MKITVKTTQEIDVQVPPYFKNGFIFYKVVGSGERAIKVHDTAIFISDILESDVVYVTPITEQEFGTAYNMAVQNIREAFLS